MSSIELLRVTEPGRNSYATDSLIWCVNLTRITDRLCAKDAGMPDARFHKVAPEPISSRANSLNSCECDCSSSYNIMSRASRARTCWLSALLYAGGCTAVVAALSEGDSGVFLDVKRCHPHCDSVFTIDRSDFRAITESIWNRRTAWTCCESPDGCWRCDGGSFSRRTNSGCDQ